MIWKTQLTFNQVMKYNNTNKCASGHSENKPSLARRKLLKRDKMSPPPRPPPVYEAEKLKLLPLLSNDEY